MKLTRLVFGVSALLLLLPLGLIAQEIPENSGSPWREPDTTESISKSQLTFHGKVTDVQYRLSEEGIPHTFVTYHISKVIHGSVEGTDQNKVTLRFIGGAKGDGGFLLPPRVPRFNLGDEDVLFVTKNGESECPLVGCSAGRLKIRHDHVYSDAGQPVIGLEKGRTLAAGKPDPALRVARYPRPDFDKLYQRKEYREMLKEKAPDADPETLRKIYNEHVPKEISFQLTHFPGEDKDGSDTDEPRNNVPSRDATSAPGKHLGISDLLETLSRNARTVTHRLAPAKSQDHVNAFSAPIALPSKATAVPPPVNREPTHAPIEGNQEELRMLRQQEFNPVLKPAKEAGG